MTPAELKARQSAYCRKWRAKHRAELLIKEQAWRDQRKEFLRAQSKAWRNTHPEQAAASRKTAYFAKRDELVAKKRAYNHARRDDINRKNREHVAAHHAETLARNAAYRKSHRDEIRAKSKAYDKANRARSAAQAMKRLASKRMACPAWVDLNALRAIYKDAATLKSTTSIDYEVDHIIPLVNKKVCGLHVPWNLRIITAYENCRKGNKFKQAA